jgi:hypothetical protein
LAPERTTMPRTDQTTPAETIAPHGRLALSGWSVIAAFGAYFCMYGFRKPFTAASFAGDSLWGIDEKAVLVIAQVLGYMASKFIGIRVIAEMPPERRAIGILALVGLAELALVAFGLAPRPLHVVCLFLNGLPLGMVFGLVLGYLEGRRHTEALTAGLCASFILADGVTKGVGTWVLDQGVTERWMPALVGLLFAPALLAFVWMLTRIPPPDPDDVAHRTHRQPMTRQERRDLVSRYWPGLAGLVAAYLLITVARSIRADFAPELWRGLGLTAVPATFAISETWVALGVLVVNGLSVLIVDNRRAFFASLAVGLAGAALMIAALVLQPRGQVGPFVFMVLMGLGLYLPYVAMHTTVFERLIAMTRERGNLGFLMYIADSIGYLGYVAVLVGRLIVSPDEDFLKFFFTTAWLIAVLASVSLVASWAWFSRRTSTTWEEAAR